MGDERMKFWKMNGAGNDFIIINNIEEKIPQAHLSQVAATLCERHLSIGADGFMVVEASSQADYRMLFSVIVRIQTFALGFSFIQYWCKVV